MIHVIAPIKILSEANGREHWRKKAARVKSHRSWARAIMCDQVGVKPHAFDLHADPITITLTRVATRTLDSDNLASGFKAVRDGVADWLGMDDGDKRLTWVYAQRKGLPKEYAAEIKIERTGVPVVTATSGQNALEQMK